MKTFLFRVPYVFTLCLAFLSQRRITLQMLVLLRVKLYHFVAASLARRITELHRGRCALVATLFL